MTHLSVADKWFNRTKDILLIGGAIWAVFVFMNGYYDLPSATANNALAIKNVEAQVSGLENSIIKINAKFERIDDKQDYTNKSLDEVKEWMRSISRRTQ